MYNQVGLLDDDAGTKGHVRTSRAGDHGDSRLSKDQKDTLIRIYRVSRSALDKHSACLV